MSAQNTTHGSTANPTTDAQSNRGRDAREGTHDDGSTDTDNNPPNDPPHGHISHGVGRFLVEVDPRTLPEDRWIEELAARFERWKDDDSEQADLSGWSE